jgi:hypothetical protein
MFLDSLFPTGCREGTIRRERSYLAKANLAGSTAMPVILWLLGVPLSVVVLLWLLGVV